MHHLAINDHVFSIVKNTEKRKNPLEGSTHTLDGGWTISDAIENPRQVKTSRALDKLVLDVIAFRGDGMDEAEAIRAIAKAQEVVTITDGRGKNWGRWTIHKVKTKYTKIIERGVSQVVKINISLVEYRQDESTSTV